MIHEDLEKMAKLPVEQQVEHLRREAIFLREWVLMQGRVNLVLSITAALMVILISILFTTKARAQKVAWPSEYTSNHYLGMWNVLQVGWELPRVNENWATWARVDCPVHIYEISERDYTPMPDCFMLIYRARTFEQIRIIPKPVSRYKNENRA